MNDPYEDQLKAARYKAERDQARQELARLRGEATTMSAYDLLPEEDREALRWVRKKGGLDAVRQRWERLSCYTDTVPRSCMEKRLARLQRQVDESHAALRRRNQRIALLESEINRAHNENRMEFLRRAGNYTAFADEVCKRLAPQLRYVEGCTKDVMDAALEALDSRLMPEGMEWPRYESGEPVLISDYVVGPSYGERLTVDAIKFCKDGFVVCDNCGVAMWYESNDRFKRHAVIAADGEMFLRGETVYNVVDGEEYRVRGFVDGVLDVCVETADGDAMTLCHDVLTHSKPEIDSWERIEEDCSISERDYYA